MKIEQNTITILKNFSQINPSIQIKEGNVLNTISPSKSIMAKATLDQSFDHTFAIYDLANFLSAISLFGQPELEFDDTKVKILSSDRKQFINYIFADPETIIIPPDNVVEKLSKITNKPDVVFHLTKASITSLQKAIAILGLPEIALSGDGTNIYVQGTNSKKNQSNYSEIIGQTDKVFSAYFKVDNIKLIHDDYTVSISSEGLAHFGNNTLDYWVAVEANSKF